MVKYGKKIVRPSLKTLNYHWPKAGHANKNINTRTVIITVLLIFHGTRVMKQSALHNDPSRSSKVIDFGTNRKHTRDFQLVLNSNFGPILPVSAMLQL